VWIHMPPVLDFKGNAPLADREDKINLRFRRPFRKMCEIEVGHSAKKGAHDAFREMTREVSEVLGPSQAFLVEGNFLLKPARAQAVINETNLVPPLLSLQAQLQGSHQLDQHGPVKEPQVAQHSVPSDVGAEHLFQLTDQYSLGSCLSRVAAGKSEDLLQQGSIASSSALAEPQIVRDDSPDHVFVQLVCNFGPRQTRSGMYHRIPASRRECLKGEVTRVPKTNSVEGEVAPEIFSEQRVEPVFRQVRLDILAKSQPCYLAEQERSELECADSAGKAVSSRLDAKRGASGNDYVQRVVVDQRLDLRGPVGEVLHLVQKEICRLSLMSDLIECLAENSVLVPADQRK